MGSRLRRSPWAKRGGQAKSTGEPICVFRECSVGWLNRAIRVALRSSMTPTISTASAEPFHSLPEAPATSASQPVAGTERELDALRQQLAQAPKMAALGELTRTATQ